MWGLGGVPLSLRKAGALAAFVGAVCAEPAEGEGPAQRLGGLDIPRRKPRRVGAGVFGSHGEQAGCLQDRPPPGSPPRADAASPALCSLCRVCSLLLERRRVRAGKLTLSNTRPL